MNPPTALFPTLLWKEWRDHRSALLGYFVAIPPLIAWGLSAVTAARRIDPMLPSAAAVCGLAIAALTLFGDLFAGEEQRGTIKLLRRLPGGLSKVFVGKISFALIAAVAMSGWAYLATTIAASLLYGGPLLPKPSLPDVSWLTLSFVVAAWIPAAAIWLSRATLALPAAALALVLFGAPIAVTLWLNPGMKATKDELVWAYLVLTSAGPLVAGASFVLGRRRSTSAFAPAAVGLLAMLALFTPAYAWTGVRVAHFLRIEPDSATFRIDTGSHRANALDPRGRYVYVNAFHVTTARDERGFGNHDPWQGDSPLHPLCIDLETGAWRELGPPGSHLFAPGQGAIRETTALVGLVLESTLDDLPRGDPGWRFFDAATGRAIEEDLAVPLSRRTGLRAGAMWRDADSLRLPDGRRVWRQEDFLVADPGRVLPDSEFGSSPTLWGSAMPGFGVVLDRLRDRTVVYDVLRERRFAVDPRLWVSFVRPGRWIVYDRSRANDAPTPRLYDPETRELGDIAGLGKGDSPLSLQDDGRLLVITSYRGQRNVEHDLVLLDPESGVREPVALPPSISLASKWVSVVGRTPGGNEILAVRHTKGCADWLIRCDRQSSAGGSTTTRTVATGPFLGFEFVGSSDEESAILVGSRRLVRVRFDGSPPEFLFPRTPENEALFPR